MLDLYFGLPSWLRTMVALTLLTIGLVMTISGYKARPKPAEPHRISMGDVPTIDDPGSAGGAQMFKIGLIVTGVGTVLTMTCGKSRAEKSGYHF